MNLYFYDPPEYEHVAACVLAESPEAAAEAIRQAGENLMRHRAPEWGSEESAEWDETSPWAGVAPADLRVAPAGQGVLLGQRYFSPDWVNP